MTLPYIEQSSKSLRLYLSTGAVDLTQFTILEEVRTELHGIEVHAGILGESHFVAAKVGNTTFYEICACTDKQASNGDNELFSSPLHELSEKYIQLAQPTLYFFSFTTESLTRHQEQTSQTLQDPHSLSLQYNFPDPTGKLASQTQLTVTYQNNKITTQSTHTYPNEDMVVYTHSVLSIPQHG